MAVSTDAVTYALLLKFGIFVTLAKATGFIAGATFAYLANRFWTFDDAENSKGSLGPFLLLYGVAILLNVSVNGASLRLVGESHFGYGISWFVATAASATLNYVGLRHLVFRRAKP